jgi:8-amino-7-oxononanoate synthase
MGNPLDPLLANRLRELEAAGLRRTLPTRESGADLVDFGSNDYLGLAREPWLAEETARTLRNHGSGSGASRLLTLGRGPHHVLEEALADWKKTEASLCFSSGYATALGTLSALLTKDDTVILDKLAHASLIDGARLSGAQIRVFPHNHLGRLEHLLRQSRLKNPHALLLVVTEGVFSMDGDRPPLREIISLKNRYGATLLVDEAHSAGVFGEQGRGVAAEWGVDREVEIHMGTLSKAFGCSGGYIAGSRTLIDWLINRARSFVYSTAPSPAVVCAAQAALDWMRTEAGRQRRSELHAKMRCLSGLLQKPSPAESPIFPVAVSGTPRVLQWSQALQAQGFRVPAIRYPTVARGAERLRLTVTARHTEEQIGALHTALKQLQAAPGDAPGETRG